MSDLRDVLGQLEPDDIAALPPELQAEIVTQLDREERLSSPAAFAEAHSNGSWLPYRHAVYISDAIVDMVEHDAYDLLIVEASVRHGKSELCSRWTPAWYIAKYREPVLLASYEADFAQQWGRKVRDVIGDIGDQYGLEINETSRAAARWEVVGGGGMNTAGAGGPITGKGGRLMIVDDPIKNEEKAYSVTERDHLSEWWNGTWLSRREPGAKLLLIMSRWHEDDLTGRLKRQVAEMGMRVRTIHLPAIAEDHDELGREPGEALCPERFDADTLLSMKKDMGPTPWLSLYQQRPMAMGGGMFKKEWLRYYTTTEIDGETVYNFDGTLVPDSEMWRFGTMDTAYTKSKRSDYTALGVWGVAPTREPSLALLDMTRRRTEHVDHAPIAQQAWDKWSPAWIGVEKIMATLSLFSELQRNGLVVRALRPDKHKVARAETAAALMEQGRIWVPEAADWLADFIDEITSFPVGVHDDQVDVLAYAARELAKRTVHPARRHRPGPTDPSEIMWERIRKRNTASHYDPVLGQWPS